MKIFAKTIYLEEYDYSCQRFVQIANKQAFLLDSVPTYYPGTSKYKLFWNSQLKHCIEGLWTVDHETLTKDTHTNEDAWRWAPPNLYFYANFGTILHQEKPGAPRTKIRPYLRDVEWEFFYNFSICRGFSGFEDDLTYSCDIRLTKDLIPLSEEAPELYHEGNLKKYVESYDYVRALHSYNKGRPLYNNPMKNLFLMGCRGFGKSYMVGVGLILHTFLFDFMIEHGSSMKPSIEIGVGAALSDKSAEILSKMMEAFHNLPGGYEDPITGKKFRSPFFKNTSGRLNQPNTRMIHKYKKKVGNLWVEGGTGSKIEHRVFTKDNPDAMAGLRPSLIIIEEVGLLENVKDVHGSNEAAQKIDQKLGISCYIGTGGNVDKVIECETIFREPTAFDMLEFDDPYEKSANKTCWFMPYHYARNIHKDKNGNTDLLKAHKTIMEERQAKMGKKNASSIIDRHLMNFPIIPSEMFLSMKGNRFPVTELRSILNNIKRDNHYLSNSSNVTLSFDSSAKNGVTYELDHNNSLKPLHEYKKYKSDYDDPQGCITIYEFPKEIDGKVPDDLYIIGYDPYVSKEQNAGSSLGAVYVFKNNRYVTEKYGYSQIVAEYVGKPYEGLDFFNENVLKLSMLYGATPRGVYFENNKGSAVYEYFHKQKKLGLLATKPKYILTSKSKTSSRFIEYGFSVPNAIIKDRILEYIYDWLIEERGIHEGEVVRNMDLIPSRGLLEELIYFNPDDNYDRLSAFAGCIIALEDDKTRAITNKRSKEKINPLAFLADNSRMFINNKNYVPFERVSEN